MAKIGYDELFDENLDNEVKKLKEEIKGLGKAVEDLAKSFKPIKKSVDEYTKSTKAASTATKEGKTQIKENAKEAAVFAEKVMLAKKATADYAKLLLETTNALKLAEANQKRLRAALIATDETTALGVKKRASLNKELQKNIDLVKKLTVAGKGEADQIKALNGSYNKLQKELKENVVRYKAMSAAQRDSTAAGKSLTASIRQQEAQLKKLDSQIGRNFRNVGNYSSALQGAKSSLMGIAAGAGIATSATLLIGQALANAVRSAIKFEKSNTVLASVLGKNVKDIKALTESALQFGRVTSKTSQEVSELQISLSRLGFVEQEIINLTGGIINGSVALNAPLEETASLVGALVNTFDDFTTSDATLIVDQLTLATQKSALNFNKLKTSLPIVAGAANAAGITFTQTTALLSKLADAGIDASMSATSLRNIFIDAKAEGLPFVSILEKIQNSTDKLTAANDAFGRRTSVSATILANNIALVGEFDRALQRAEGTAQKAADTIKGSLSVKIDLLASAWDGLVKSILQGDSALSSGAGFLVEFFTAAANSASNGISQFAGYGVALEKLTKQIKAAGVAGKESAAGLLETGTISEISDELIELDTTYKFLEIRIKQLQDSSEKAGIKFKLVGEQKVALAEVAAQIEVLTKRMEKLTDEEQLAANALRDAALSAQDLADFLSEINMEMAQSNGDEFASEVVAGIDRMTKSAQEFEQIMMDIEKLSSEDQAAFDKEDADALAESAEQADKYAESLEEVALKKQQLLDAALMVASGIADAFTSLNELRNNQIDQELQTVLNARDAEIAAADGNAAEIAIIQDRFAKKQEELNREKAKNDKQSALFQALINTAVGITAALTSIPPNVPLSIAVGATGLFQAGVIASTPLPAFADGTKFSPDGPALVGEKGTEMIVTPDGQVALTPNVPTVVDLERGSQILTAQETVKALSNFNDGARELTMPDVVVEGLTRADLQNQTAALQNSFENQVQSVTEINKNGVESFMKHRGRKTKYYNERYR